MEHSQGRGGLPMRFARFTVTCAAAALIAGCAAQQDGDTIVTTASKADQTREAGAVPPPPPPPTTPPPPPPPPPAPRLAFLRPLELRAGETRRERSVSESAPSWQWRASLASWTCDGVWVRGRWAPQSMRVALRREGGREREARIFANLRARATWGPVRTGEGGC